MVARPPRGPGYCPPEIGCGEGARAAGRWDAAPLGAAAIGFLIGRLSHTAGA